VKSREQDKERLDVWGNSRVWWRWWWDGWKGSLWSPRLPKLHSMWYFPAPWRLPWSTAPPSPLRKRNKFNTVFSGSQTTNVSFLSALKEDHYIFLLFLLFWTTLSVKAFLVFAMAPRIIYECSNSFCSGLSGSNLVLWINCLGTCLYTRFCSNSYILHM